MENLLLILMIIILKDGVIRTWCVVWDREHVKDDWLNSLNVSAGSLEFKKFIQNEAYK